MTGVGPWATRSIDRAARLRRDDLRHPVAPPLRPFHKLGATKYEALGLPFRLSDTPGPTREPVERVRTQFRAHGLVAH